MDLIYLVTEIITIFRALLFDQNNNNQDGRAGFKGFLFLQTMSQGRLINRSIVSHALLRMQDSGMYNSNKKLDRKLNGYCKTFKR